MAIKENKITKNAIMLIENVSEKKSTDYKIDVKDEKGEKIKDGKGGFKQEERTAEFHMIQGIDLRTGERITITCKPEKAGDIVAGKTYVVFYEQIEKIDTKRKLNVAMPHTGPLPIFQTVSEDHPFGTGAVK